MCSIISDSSTLVSAPAKHHIVIMFWMLCLLPFVQTYSVTFTCPEICVCDSEITNCQYNGLAELPSDIDLEIVNLDLSYNNFETFPTNIGKFLELKYLNISHNRISTIKFSDFIGLENLESLDVTFNLFHDWKDIHSSAFVPTKKLQFLDFSSNPLRNIPKYSNHLYIESLIILRLTNCSMKSIPVNVFNRLTNLRELYLSNNPIATINETFQLDNLKVMDMSGCRLNYIDENVFASLINLEKLILRNNVHLKKLTCHSEYLIFLDLAECTMEKIPSGILSKLTRLDLSGNYLKTIPANSFRNFINLQVLNLSTNAITSIHDTGFQGMGEVITIDLSFNKLTTLGENLLNNNSALTYLNLSHNYISSLDSISSKSLKMLIASYCEIYDLNRYSLSQLPNLITLMLSRNFLTSLPDGLIARSLGILDVSYCRIKSLNNRTFDETFNLRQINLASNALTSIDPSYFPRAFNVIIKDNPWRCDCSHLKRMYEWMTTYGANRLNDLICDSPETVEGKTWENACINEWYPNHIAKDTMWYYSVGVVVAMIIALFAVVLLRRIKSVQEERLRTQEEARRTEERETLRRMQERQREMREEEDRNAPDPRELQGPPSYTEALLLPRLDASHPSLAGSVHSFGSRPSLIGSSSDIAKKNRIRRKRRRRKSEEERRVSRITVDDSDSSDGNQSQDQLSARRKLPQVPPLESDF